jgi:Na+-driven multidrug efflux pump
MIVCQVVGVQFIRIFSTDPSVVAVGREYLRIISWTFVASGIIYVSSSMFQAMGNTLPSLFASFIRIAVVAITTFWMARMAGFDLTWIWYLSLGSVAMQLAISLLLLRREFRRRLAFQTAHA